jgi:predicted ATP-grasp superfamily ATP-dependent carboligase
VPADLPSSLASELSAAAVAVAGALGLRGLAGADFLIDGQGWHLLEINPRPGASLEAWELATCAPLVARHVAACRGALGPTPLPPTTAAATAIVYSPVRIRVPRRARWPAWTGDRGPAESLVEPGGPLCTVRATGGTATAARTAVGLKRAAVLARFGGRRVRDDAA